jgi:ankyrin repeat protein
MCPEALKSDDEIGYRPLGLLCARDDVPLETVKTLAEKNSEAFQIPDTEGCTPLHDACEEGSMQVVSFLATRFPDAARVKSNNRGFTPLHCICGRDTPASVEVVSL